MEVQQNHLATKFVFLHSIFLVYGHYPQISESVLIGAALLVSHIFRHCDNLNSPLFTEFFDSASINYDLNNSAFAFCTIKIRV
jgi:dolichol kinase